MRFATHRRLSLTALAVFSALVLLASPASAQSLGIRAGASSDPDQFFFGGHLETRPLADRLRFRPNAEIGIGEDITLVALNLEFAYHFETTKPWGVYAGGGPALNLFSSDRRDEAEGGFNIMVGLEHRQGLFGELKVGTIDSPDLKLTVGYVLRKR